MESQGSSEADIKTLASSKGMDFTVTAGGDVKGAVISGIPAGYLFGADGNMVTDKVHGGDLEKQIAALCKESPGAMAGPGPYVKLAPLAAQVKSGIGLGNVLKTLVTKKLSKDPTEASEATAMYDALHTSLQEQLDSALEQKAEEPLTALAKLDRIAMQFAGDELAKKATDQAATMRKDPHVKMEIDGEQKWKYIQGLYGKLKPGAKGSKDPADESFRKVNLDALMVIVAGCRHIVEHCPKTAAATRAQEVVDQFVAPTAPKEAKTK
jgi:hypothetical protein